VQKYIFSANCPNFYLYFVTFVVVYVVFVWEKKRKLSWLLPTYSVTRTNTNKKPLPLALKASGSGTVLES
jgi:hypothetical protein